MAGNMWEWTTETGDHKTTKPTSTPSTDGNFAVLRGGGFSDVGSSRPVSRRVGDYGTGGTYFYIGFRVVLYIK